MSNEVNSNVNDYKVIKVDAFVEKPNVETAKEYIGEGYYLMEWWNVYLEY